MKQSETMKTAIVYTVLSLANLVGFALGILFLPAQVPIHFDASMTADVIGSPWVYLALPGAAALISGALFATLSQKKNRAVTAGLLSALGIALATIGWTFFALAASGVKIGEKTDFPFMLVVVLPISLLFVWLGNYMPRIEPNRLLGIRTGATLKSEEVWIRTHRFGGALFFAAGLVSSAVMVIFACVPALASMQYAALILFAVLVLAATVASFVYAETLYRREKARDRNAEGSRE